MKRVLSVWISVVLCLVSFSACDSNDPVSQTPSPSAISTTATIATSTVTTATQQVEEPIMPTEPDEEANSTPLFYKATDADGDVVWLLGTIHIGNEQMYPLPKVITQAYDHAEILAVEADISADLITLSETYAQRMMYADGETIVDHIPEELYLEAKSILTENDSYSPMYDRLIPYMWYELVEQECLNNTEYVSEQGVDMHFLKRAAEDGKTVVEIEGAAFQMELKLSFSEEIQTTLLEAAVEQYHTDPAAQINELVALWREGDEAAFTSSLDSEDEEVSPETRALLEEYNDKMIFNRNKVMTDYAESCLFLGDEAFICVGAAHVIGEEGIVAQLRERGYTVTLMY